MSRMVTLQDPKTGAKVCINHPSPTAPATADQIEAAGYPGWTVVAEHDQRPAEQLTADEREAARLNGLTRFQLVQEIKALIAAGHKTA